MNVSEKMKALTSAFEKKTTTSSNSNANWKLFFKFWSMPDDSTVTVRWLPDLNPENPFGFLVENLQHEVYVNGEKKYVACASMYGEDCPFCAASRNFYAQKDEINGKKFYRKLSYIGQALILESPIEYDQTKLIHLVDFGPAMFKQIQAGFKSGDLDNPPYDLKGGYNFRIRKTKDGKYASYSTSSFAAKQSDVDDEIIDKLELYNLADFRAPKMERAAMEALLTAALTGSEIHDTHESETPKAEPEAVKPVQQEVSHSTPQPAPAPTTGMSALEKLRAKAKAQATA